MRNARQPVAPRTQAHIQSERRAFFDSIYRNQIEVGWAKRARSRHEIALLYRPLRR